MKFLANGIYPEDDFSQDCLKFEESCSGLCVLEVREKYFSTPFFFFFVNNTHMKCTGLESAFSYGNSSLKCNEETCSR